MMGDLENQRQCKHLKISQAKDTLNTIETVEQKLQAMSMAPNEATAEDSVALNKKSWLLL
jgi:hypothetical protein